MKNVRSFSTNQSIGSTSKQFLLPSIPQLLLEFFIAIGLILVFNIKNAWNYLNQNVIQPNGGLNKILPKNSTLNHRVADFFTHSIALQLLFWVGVGCVVYAMLWFLKNISINILNDIAAANYVHPTSYKGIRFWGSVLMRKVFFGASAVLLIIYLGVFIQLLNNTANLCYRLATNYQSLHVLGEIAVSVMATTALIYILVLLTRVTVSSWHAIYRDL